MDENNSRIRKIPTSYETEFLKIIQQMTLASLSSNHRLVAQENIKDKRIITEWELKGRDKAFSIFKIGLQHPELRLKLSAILYLGLLKDSRAIPLLENLQSQLLLEQNEQVGNRDAETEIVEILRAISRTLTYLKDQPEDPENPWSRDGRPYDKEVPEQIRVERQKLDDQLKILKQSLYKYSKDA